MIGAELALALTEARDSCRSSQCTRRSIPILPPFPEGWRGGPGGRRMGRTMANDAQTCAKISRIPSITRGCEGWSTRGLAEGVFGVLSCLAVWWRRFAWRFMTARPRPPRWSGGGGGVDRLVPVAEVVSLQRRAEAVQENAR